MRHSQVQVELKQRGPGAGCGAVWLSIDSSRLLLLLLLLLYYCCCHCLLLLRTPSLSIDSPAITIVSTGDAPRSLSSATTATGSVAASTEPSIAGAISGEWGPPRRGLVAAITGAPKASARSQGHSYGRSHLDVDRVCHTNDESVRTVPIRVAMATARSTRSVRRRSARQARRARGTARGSGKCGATRAASRR